MKSLPLSATTETLLSKSLTCRFDDKNLHSRFIIETNDWQVVSFFFLNFNLISRYTFWMHAAFRDIDGQSITFTLLSIFDCVGFFRRVFEVVSKLFLRCTIIINITRSISHLSSVRNKRCSWNLCLNNNPEHSPWSDV